MATSKGRAKETDLFREEQGAGRTGHYAEADLPRMMS